MSLSGVGIGLRREHFDEVFATGRRVDWLEFVPDNALADQGRTLTVTRACAERWPLGSHGVSLSLGGPDPLDMDLVSRLGRLLDALGIDEHTDHACWSAAGGVMFFDLLPLPMTLAAAEHLARRTREVIRALGRPLLLENISAYAVMPSREPAMDEGEFLRCVLELSGAGLLLDVNNVWVNATNQGIDPLALLESLPLDKTGRIHLAGHVERHGMLVDNHGSPVCEGVWQLYEAALTRVGPVPTLIEWDTDVPALDLVLDEADHARRLWTEARMRQPDGPVRTS